jgi:Lanthionine-containing peptide SapB precursor RamS
MALLDIQAMDTARDTDKGHGGCGGSDLSVLLCDSFASTILCL